MQVSIDKPSDIQFKQYPVVPEKMQVKYTYTSTEKLINCTNNQ